MTVDETVLGRRFAQLAGAGNGDWGDVRRRARSRSHRTAAVVVAALALVFVGVALGADLIGVFEPHGKWIPLESLSPQDRSLVELAMCNREDFARTADGAPRVVCMDDEPTIEEIANDGYEFRWSVRYPSGAVCTATGRVRGFGAEARHAIGMYDCSASAAEQRYPRPDRPITADVAISASSDHPEAQLFEVSGLAGSGIESVGLVESDGSVLRTPVRGRAYSFRDIPDRPWVALAAFDAKGQEVYREPLRYKRETGNAPSSTQVPAVPARPQRPSGAPVQRLATDAAFLEAFANGVVSLRLGDAAYHRLMEVSDGVSPVTVVCGRLAFGAGRWQTIGGVGGALAARELVVRVARPFDQEAVAPPFDFCETNGIGEPQHWQEAGPPRELVEVPLTLLGRRYLDERAAARDLAFFIRAPNLRAARSAPEIARRLGDRVVPLPNRDGSAGAGRVGVWSAGDTIVVSEKTREGRRLYVTIRGKTIGATNVRGLAELR
jgi:hypothetical protein